MKKEEIIFVDKVRSEWFLGNKEVSPAQLLKNIPLQMKQLINIIDKLNNENIELKEKIHG